MITAITNTSSRAISGTTYYSDGCLYTTSYSKQIITSVPYISTQTDTGTYYTTSSKLTTTATHRGPYNWMMKWCTTYDSNYMSEGETRYGPLHSSLSPAERTEVSEYYNRGSITYDRDESITVSTYDETASSWGVSLTLPGDPVRNKFSYPVLFQWTNSYSVLNGTRRTDVSQIYSNIRLELEKNNSTYSITYSDSNDFAKYTSGSGSYGKHTGSINGTYTTFDYISVFKEIEDTITTKSVYTEKGQVTKGYYYSSSEKTLYPRVPYTISSYFSGYNISTSEKMVVDTYTMTLLSHGNAPSAVSGLSLDYFKTGTYSTGITFEYDGWNGKYKDIIQNEASDGKYVFSVMNQRDKSYFVVVGNHYTGNTTYPTFSTNRIHSAYIITPYEEMYIGNQTETMQTNTTISNNVKTTSIYTMTTNWTTGTDNAYIKIYQLDGWNKTSWGLSVWDEGNPLTQEVTHYSVPYGVTFSSLITSYTADSNFKSDSASDWDFFTGHRYKSSYSETFNRASNVYIDTMTENIYFNGYGVLKYDYSYTITTTYGGAITHYVDDTDDDQTYDGIAITNGIGSLLS